MMNERPLFSFSPNKPALVCSLSDRTAAETICSIREGISDGADGFLLHLEKLVPEDRSEQSLRRVFSYLQHRPIMVTNYRYENFSPDEVIFDELMVALRAGASCLDLMCDLFDRQEPQLPTRKPEAVAKLRAAIDAVHAEGGQLLLSSHPCHLTTEQLVDNMCYMESLGADIVKTAMGCDTYEQSVEAVAQTYALKKVLHVPYYFGLGGRFSRAHRILAPLYGSAFIFCVPHYGVNTQLCKPLLRAVRRVVDNFDYGIDR